MDEQLLTPELTSFIESIQSLKDIDEDILNDDLVDAMMDNFDQVLTKDMINQAINDTIKNFEAQNQTREQAKAGIEAVKELVNEIVYGDEVLVGYKKKLLDRIVERLFSIFDQAMERYHSYAIELPIMLEDGAQVPTYAHDSDAAADMYALEDVIIPAHFKGAPVKTGVHIQLPEGWVAFILPRSSIGAKTPLRLSNSAGVIDSGYRGEVRALYDNIGDESYEIHKGDRIAQMLVMPSYRFKANIVDSLEDSDRGEGGFGSTGT